jgi:hypothetical protein
MLIKGENMAYTMIYLIEKIVKKSVLISRTYEIGLKTPADARRSENNGSPSSLASVLVLLPMD